MPVPDVETPGVYSGIPAPDPAKNVLKLKWEPPNLFKLMLRFEKKFEVYDSYCDILLSNDIKTGLEPTELLSKEPLGEFNYD